MDSDKKKLIDSIGVLRQDRGVDLQLLDAAFQWGEEFLCRRGSCPLGGRLMVGELDPVETLALSLGHAWLENCHERWYEQDTHKCNHAVTERLKAGQFLAPKYWGQLTRSTHMFPRAVFMDKDVIRDWLGLVVSFWTSDEAEDEAKKDPALAKLTMREGVRFFRYYYYIASLSWKADPRLSSKFIAANSPVIDTVERQIDELIKGGHASDTGVNDTISGIAAPIAPIELRKLKYPSNMVTPSVDQLISQNMRQSASEARKQDPTRHWAAMSESTRDAWRLACLALKVEQGTKDTFFSFYEKYAVRWHEWESKECQMKLHQPTRDSNPHPRICSIGTGWMVTGVFDKKRWTVVSTRFAHSMCVWIQAMACLHRGVLETGDRLNESFFKPIALQLPRVDPRS